MNDQKNLTFYKGSQIFNNCIHRLFNYEQHRQINNFINFDD